jgi:hypothetical protein
MRQATCPTGKSPYANPKKIGFVQPSREKYSASVFRKDVVLSRPSRLDKRDERVVTIVGRGAMDADRIVRRAMRDADG